MFEPGEESKLKMKGKNAFFLRNTDNEVKKQIKREKKHKFLRQKKRETMQKMEEKRVFEWKTHGKKKAKYAQKRHK